MILCPLCKKEVLENESVMPSLKGQWCHRDCMREYLRMDDTTEWTAAATTRLVSDEPWDDIVKAALALADEWTSRAVRTIPQDVAVTLAAEVRRLYEENYERRDYRSLGGYRDPEMDR